MEKTKNTKGNGKDIGIKVFSTPIVEMPAVFLSKEDLYVYFNKVIRKTTMVNNISVISHQSSVIRQIQNSLKAED